MLKEVSNLAEFTDKAADLNKSMMLGSGGAAKQGNHNLDGAFENPFACSKEKDNGSMSSGK